MSIGSIGGSIGNEPTPSPQRFARSWEPDFEFVPFGILRAEIAGCQLERAMPLNEREQRILEEIERQFYEDDPKLAETVANTTLGDLARRKRKWAGVGFILGLVVMLSFFTRNRWVALGGFVAMVISVGWIAMTMNRPSSDRLGQSTLGGLSARLRQRWLRDR